MARDGLKFIYLRKTSLMSNMTVMFLKKKENQMKEIMKVACLGIISLVLISCGSNKTYTIQIHPPIINPPSTKQIALFLDGTQNDRDSRTNVSTLSEIVKHQNKDNLYMFYNEGVGTDGKFVGAGTGSGIDKDVAEAYAFFI